MKYTHYSPNAKVFLVKGSFSQFKDYVNDKKDSAAICFSGEENLLDIPAISLGEQNDSLKHAHNLFRSLRKTDEMNVNYVYIRHPSPHGVGFAVLNRLLKAADFEVIHL
jgi:L-threonylcarbamoyladenylate synthase